MINILKQKNKVLIEKYTNELNKEQLKKQLIISSLLQDKSCFFKIPMETAISLILDLGFSKDKATSMYKELTSFEEFKKINKDN